MRGEETMPDRRLQQRGPTVKDVAALAGVSVMSVSRVCDPNYTGQVSPEMRSKVVEAIQALGYRPDYAARSLRKGRTDTVGFYNGYRGLMLLSDDFPRSLFIGLQDELTNLGQDLLIYNVPDNPRSPADVVHDVSMSKVDGIVFLPQHGDEELSQLLSESHQKVVTIVEAMPGLPAITAQDSVASAQLARHLYERGHRHVMYRRARANLTSSRRRFEAFSAEAAKLGMLVTATTTTELYDVLDDVERETIRQSRSLGFTAIVGWHDYAAVMAMLFCRDIGMTIPGDMAFAGFDKLKPAICPKGIDMTTVVSNWTEVARRGVDYIVGGVDAAFKPEREDHLRDNGGLPEIQIQSPLYIGNTT